MFKILDRYLIREIAVPFALSLTVLTFVLMIPPILREGETLIAQGARWSIIAQALLMLLPQALGVTIPMSVLLGILIGFGRLSADREFVALQACGVGLKRLMRPVAVVAIIGTAATAYELIVALPDANQRFREIVFVEVAARVQSVKPRVFFEDFPNRVIYVRDTPPGGGWRDVFLAESEAGRSTVYFAREGRIALDSEKRLVQLQLTDGVSHTTTLGNAESYESGEFGSTSIALDPATVFKPPPPRNAPEMTFAELSQAITQAESRGDPAYLHRFMFQQKLSLPATCPILALIGLALGATNRKDGKLAGFVVGIGVIFVYYVLLFSARAAALGGRFSPDWAPWVPNIVMGAVAVLMLLWRARAADQPIRLSMPAFWQRRMSAHASPAGGPAVRVPTDRPQVVLVVRVPHLNLPMPRLLDLYVVREYLRVFALGLFGLLGIFYISTFIDLADKLFRGAATTGLLLRFFYYQTPQYVYYVVPMAVLLATLVTVGVMSKNSELVVMRACGISLYRTAAPLLVFGLAASAALFGMQEKGLAYTNREADRLNSIIRGYPPARSAATRQWISGTAGAIYHYDSFTPETNSFSRLWTYNVDERSWELQSMAFAEEVVVARQTGPDGRGRDVWMGRKGWMREFSKARKNDRETVAVKYVPFTERELPLEPPSYFKTESRESELMTYGDLMTYGELRGYIARLQASGVYVVPYVVALHRKIAFPFVTVIMTLLAVPFAVTTGRRGALYGIGVGIVLGILYWITLSLFAALGSGGVLTPVLAAWAPNILFSAAALYMILTVKT